MPNTTTLHVNGKKVSLAVAGDTPLLYALRNDRWQSIKRYVNKVPHYINGRELMDEWGRRNPGKALNYDPGNMIVNMFFKLCAQVGSR